MNDSESGAVVDPTVEGASKRLVSLDALRGFDMFWIVGAEGIVHALRKISSAGPIDRLATQLTHAEWEGFHFYDLIFPLFVFIVGVSLVFSLGKSIERDGRSVAMRRVVRRAVLLYLIGLFYYGGISKGFHDIRLMGVLQRIALCYGFAGLMFCTLRLRGLIGVCVGLLVGYCALLTFVPVPDVGAGHFEEGANLTNYVDKQFLPLFKWDGDHDPEGLLSTLPAVATCLLGVFAGLLLRRETMGPQWKVVCLLGAGAASIALGTLWGHQFPVIKKIWTSSYVLVAGGWSCVLLAAFYQVIDIWRIQAWARPFVWIGLNPITIYLAHNLIEFSNVTERIIGGEIRTALGVYADLLSTFIVLAMSFLIVGYLHRKRVYLRL